MVDISRQYFVNFAGKLYGDTMEAYRAKDLLALVACRSEFINLLETLETLLGSNKNFLLGRQWLNPAKSIPGKSMKSIRFITLQICSNLKFKMENAI